MTGVQTFRKKPVAIQAIQVIDSESFSAAAEWMTENGYPWLVGDATDPSSLYVKGRKGMPVETGIWIDPADGALMIRTLEGDMRVTTGDHVIQGVHGEFYPCKPHIFADTYDDPSSGTPASEAAWIERVNAVIDVFENCDDEADPGELRPLVLTALGVSGGDL